jgi:hypothetical protein
MINLRLLTIALQSIFLIGCSSFHAGKMDEIKFQSAHINALDIENKERMSIMQNRSLTSRTFYVSNQQYISSAIIATLQDMGYFVIDSGAPGYMSASRPSYTEDRVMVVYKSENDEFVTIRINFSRSLMHENVDLQYQRFFSSITKSLFLMDNGL